MTIGQADPIRAAGVVCLRENPAIQTDGRRPLEVLLVHRTRLHDWSLPKGKLEPGEHPVVHPAGRLEGRRRQPVESGQPRIAHL